MISKIPGNQQANIAINNLGLQASDILKKKFMKEVIRKGGVASHQPCWVRANKARGDCYQCATTLARLLLWNGADSRNWRRYSRM